MARRKAKKRVIRRRRRLNGLGQSPSATGARVSARVRANPSAKTVKETDAVSDLVFQALKVKDAAVRAALARKCDAALELHEESARLFGVISNKAKSVRLQSSAKVKDSLDLLRTEIRNGQKAARLCYLNQPYSLIEALNKMGEES